MIGARSPAKFAVQLVIAIKIPAKRGVMSKWLILKPEYIPPLKPMPSVNNATVKSLLQPVYDAQMRQIAGTY